MDAGQFRPRLGVGAVAALFPQHHDPGDASLVGQLVLCTLAGFAFARFAFSGPRVAFSLVLLQLMVVPEVLIVENYQTMAGSVWSTPSSASACPISPARSASFCCARPSRRCRRSWTRPPGSRAAPGCRFCWKVYVPLARPTYIAYALVSVSYHWNNFLWPLVITNSVATRPLTVGLAIFGAPDRASTGRSSLPPR